MKHLKAFNEGSQKPPHKKDPLALLVVEFLTLMKEKGYSKIDNFRFQSAAKDQNFIKISENGKELYTIWIQNTDMVGKRRVGGGILCYYPGERDAFAVGINGDNPWISEKKDYLKCIKEFKKIISSLKSGEKGTKGKFIFNQIPSLEPNEPIKPIDTSLLKPETLAAIRKIWAANE